MILSLTPDGVGRGIGAPFLRARQKIYELTFRPRKTLTRIPSNITTRNYDCKYSLYSLLSWLLECDTIGFVRSRGEKNFDGNRGNGLEPRYMIIRLNKERVQCSF